MLKLGKLVQGLLSSGNQTFANLRVLWSAHQTWLLLRFVRLRQRLLLGYLH